MRIPPGWFGRGAPRVAGAHSLVLLGDRRVEALSHLDVLGLAAGVVGDDGRGDLAELLLADGARGVQDLEAEVLARLVAVGRGVRRRVRGLTK